MSIATEIQRIQNAKANIKTAIEGKGVTVPSLATLDDYADYVEEITGGVPARREIIISDDSLTSSSNINTYFSGILDDWYTKPYVLFLKEAPTILNEITNICSGYLDNIGIGGRVYRAASNLISFNNTDYTNRNIKVVQGHTYVIYELDIMRT